MRSKRTLRLAVIAAGALLLLLLVGAGIDLFRIRADLLDGRERLDELDLDAVRTAGGVGPLIDQAAGSIDSAANLARKSPFLRVLSPLPFVGNQIDGLRELTGATDDLGDLAIGTGERIDASLDLAGESGKARIDLLDVVLEELNGLGEAIETIDTGSTRLIGPGAAARDELESALADAPERLARAAIDVRAVRDLLDGPSTYLLVVANNAEMRAGAGMPLQAGPITFTNGEFEVGELESTVSELFVANPTGEFNAHPPEQLLSTYPRWNIGSDFPEIAVSPNFPVNAPMYADLALDAQGWQVDGVLQIDTVALENLLDVIGPVEVDGEIIDSENAARKVLNEAYLEFDSVEVRDERLDQQSALAQALFSAIETADVEPLDLVAALEDSAAGRHLMAWSRDLVVQDLFTSFGASGAVPPGVILVSVQNTAANKLDFFIDPIVDMQIRQLEDRRAVTMRVTVPNPVPEETSAYVDGRMVTPRGTHRTLVSFHLPASASNVEFSDFEPTEEGFDGPLRVIGTRFTIPRGSEQMVKLHFDLPNDLPGVGVLPSGRLRPVTWNIQSGDASLVTVDDAVPFGFPLPPPDGRHDRRMEIAWAVMALGLAVVAVTVLTRTAAKADSLTDLRAVRLARIDLRLAQFLLAAAVLATALWWFVRS